MDDKLNRKIILKNNNISKYPNKNNNLKKFIFFKNYLFNTINIYYSFFRNSYDSKRKW